jgi:catechol 2,3-dioxygenase-like lactoylglutathione lyase family enzyme
MDARPAAILAAEPQLFVRDVAAASRFYADALGFDVAFTYGEPPFYGQVARGGARLNLRHVDGPVYDPEFRAREEEALAATLLVDDAQALFGEFQRAGAPFHRPLRQEPWGAKTFVVQDPDGNLICFAGGPG